MDKNKILQYTRETEQKLREILEHYDWLDNYEEYNIILDWISEDANYKKLSTVIEIISSRLESLCHVNEESISSTLEYVFSPFIELTYWVNELFDNTYDMVLGHGFHYDLRVMDELKDFVDEVEKVYKELKKNISKKIVDSE